MDEKRLKEILKLHKKWLNGDAGGVKADLREANLYRADLREVDLREADLREVDLYGADLRGANLRGADLREADLYGADLREADLRGANLRGADLYEVDLHGADFPDYKIVPKEGSFIAFTATTKGVVKLLIPEDAKRLAPISSRECRASKVIVLEGYPDAIGTIYKDFVYESGKTLEESDFNDDIRNPHSGGIHFFMTRKEAEKETWL